MLKSNSIYFMFYNIFSETKGKKVIHWGVGNGGTILISSWKFNYSIYFDIKVYYMDIQEISTLLCLLLVHYVLFPSIPLFFYITAPRNFYKLVIFFSYIFKVVYFAKTICASQKIP